MDIKRTGSQPSGKGPEDYFTGVVRVDPLFSPPALARVLGAIYQSSPALEQHGTRTRWDRL